MTVAPWIEVGFNPLDEVLGRLAAQTHRRSIKTHTPADGIPFFAARSTSSSRAMGATHSCPGVTTGRS
jgi:hypothetical protein